MTDNVSVISSLPDTPQPPTYSAAVIKTKFDEAANKIKTYINDTLIPDVESAAVSGIAAIKKLLVSYTAAGSYVFKTSEHPSIGGVYDVVLIGGGGGGSTSNPAQTSLATGGGAGAVNKQISVTLDGNYTVSVGAAGTCNATNGTNGGTTMMFASDFTFIQSASGGYASSQTNRIGKGGGIGGSDSVYMDGTSGCYGRGGDNEYGRGARGAALYDDARPAMGYGAGGWSTFAPTCGAVFIYGYEGV